MPGGRKIEVLGEDVLFPPGSEPAREADISSGSSDASAMAKYSEYGFDDIIPKPWRTSELGEELRRVLTVDLKPLNQSNENPGP